jgi:hypothetical protein
MLNESYWKNDRGRLCGSLGGVDRLRIRRNDDLNLEADQLISQGRKSVGLTFSESGFDGYILSLNVTERTEPCRQCRGPMRGTGKSPRQKKPIR